MRWKQISSFCETDEPIKSAGASVQSTIGSRGVRISGSSAGYTTFRGSVSVLATHSTRQFPLQFPSRASQCAIRFQLDSTHKSRRVLDALSSVALISQAWMLSSCVISALRSARRLVFWSRIIRASQCLIRMVWTSAYRRSTALKRDIVLRLVAFFTVRKILVLAPWHRHAPCSVHFAHHTGIRTFLIVAVSGHGKLQCYTCHIEIQLYWNRSICYSCWRCIRIRALIAAFVGLGNLQYYHIGVLSLWNSTVFDSLHLL